MKSICFRIFIPLMALFLFLFPFPALASPITQAEQEKQEAEARQEELNKRVTDLEDSKEDVQNHIQKLVQELARSMTNISILEADMKKLKDQIQKEDREYEKAKEDQEHQYQLMKKRIQYLYEEGNVTYLDILLKAKNIGDVVVQKEYFKQLYQYDIKMLENYEEVKKQVLERKKTLEEKTSELEGMNLEYQIQKSVLEDTIKKKKQESDAFEEKLKKAQEESKALEETIRKKNHEIELLIRQELARQSQKKQSMGEIKSIGGSEFGRQVADYALQFVGNPYVYGGTSLTNGADCSGFVQSVYKQFGVSIPRTSAQQTHFGKEIEYENMEPGDLICYSGHVSMYIGDGRIVHASSAKAGIKVDSNPAYRTIVSIRRPWQPEQGNGEEK